MAARYKNGAAVWSIDRQTEAGSTIKMSFHANGHILAKVARGTWKQWAIVPIDSMGSVADYLIDKGYQFTV